MLPVYFEEQSVGLIHADPAGPRFVYDQGWLNAKHAFPISVTMPLSQAEISSAQFLIWAANLLPEAEQLAILSGNLGMAQNDIIGLIEAIGCDTAGALSFGSPGKTDQKEWKEIGTDADLERILDELPRKPFLAGEDGVSMSLAGVQTKLAVAVNAQGNICIPMNGAPSTHILKPDSDRLFGSVQNEAYCLELARLCKLNVPYLTTGIAGKRQYFLIERYDRRASGDLWHRIHQEDFCQVLGKLPAAKYEKNRTGANGPALPDMFAAVRKYTLAPASDVLRLLDAAVFNILACNTDAHAKNYSMMVLAGGQVQMAPLYDVMCADPYENITRNLAQTIADKNSGEHLKRRHWLRFINAAGLGPSTTLRRISKLTETVSKNLAAARTKVEAMPAGGHALLPSIEKAIAARCRSILNGLDDMEGADI